MAAHVKDSYDQLHRWCLHCGKQIKYRMATRKVIGEGMDEWKQRKRQFAAAHRFCVKKETP